MSNGVKLLLVKPFLVKRYHDALKAITGKEIDLDAFSIDASGYSPEIGEILGPNYLNTDGGRHYILISNDQMECGIIHQHFSTTEDVLKRFFKGNKEALTALTAYDAVYGLMKDGVDYRKANPDVDSLLIARDVLFTVKTPSDIAGKVIQLQNMFDKFLESDMWQDDAHINHMLDIVKVTGDVRRSSMSPKNLTYKCQNFHTDYFGGVYVFGDTIVHLDPNFRSHWISHKNNFDGLKTIPMNVDIRQGSAKPVMQFLIDHKMISTSLKVEIKFITDEKQKHIERVMEYLVLKAFSDENPDVDLTVVSAKQIQDFLHKHKSALTSEYTSLAALMVARRNKVGGQIQLDAQHFMHFLDAENTENKAMVEHLMAHYRKSDFIYAFKHNKDVFTSYFNACAPNMQAFILHTLKEQKLI